MIDVNVSEPADVRAALVYSVNKDSIASVQMKCTVVKPKGWSSWEQDPFLSLLVSEFVMNRGLSSLSNSDGFAPRNPITTTRVLATQGRFPAFLEPPRHPDPMAATRHLSNQQASQPPSALPGPGLCSIFDILATCQPESGPFDLRQIAQDKGNGFWEFVQQQIALVHVDSLERPSSCTVCQFNRSLDYLAAIRTLLSPTIPSDPLSTPSLWDASREQVARQLTAANIEHAFL